MSKPITDGKIEIIYKNNLPDGIRDRTGYLFLFTGISRYQGQEERYKREVDQQQRLADFLLISLQHLSDKSSRSQLIKDGMPAFYINDQRFKCTHRIKDSDYPVWCGIEAAKLLLLEDKTND